MGLIGAGIGAVLGLRGGFWGVLAGASIGHWAEEKIRAHGAKPRPPREEVPSDAPYRVLGLSSASSDAALLRAYREKAKRYHPDTIRAQGGSEADVARANEKMADLNAAWGEIRKARGL